MMSLFYIFSNTLKFPTSVQTVQVNVQRMHRNLSRSQTVLQQEKESRFTGAVMYTGSSGMEWRDGTYSIIGEGRDHGFGGTL